MLQHTETTCLLYQSPTATVVIDGDLKITYANQAASYAFFQPINHLLNQSLLSLDQSVGMLQLLATYASLVQHTHKPTSIKIALEGGDGQRFYKTQIRSLNENEIGLFFEDISDLVNAENRLREKITKDPVTQLLNREQFLHQGGQELATAKRFDSPVSVMTIYLKNGQHLRHIFGQSVLDHVLQKLAGIVNQSMRESDFAARGAKYHFFLCLKGATLEKSDLVKQRILSLNQSLIFMLTDISIKADIYCHIATYNKYSDQNFEALLHRAERSTTHDIDITIAN